MWQSRKRATNAFPQWEWQQGAEHVFPHFFKSRSQQSTVKKVHALVCLPVHPSNPSTECVLCQSHWLVSRDTKTSMTPDCPGEAGDPGEEAGMRTYINAKKVLWCRERCASGYCGPNRMQHLVLLWKVWVKRASGGKAQELKRSQRAKVWRGKMARLSWELWAFRHGCSTAVRRSGPEMSCCFLCFP